jgi:hypothetical protein
LKTAMGRESHRGFESHTLRSCDVARHRGHLEPSSGSGCFLFGAGGLSGGLVVPGRVEGQFAEQFAGRGVDDADVQVLDQEQDAGSGVGAAGTDVVQPPAGAQGDVAGLADLVAADAVVGVTDPVTRDGFGPGCAGGGRGGAVRQGAVRPLTVADGSEGIQEGLQLGEGGGLDGLGTEPVLEGRLEPLDFPLGLGTLTDNGMVFATRSSGGRGGRLAGSGVTSPAWAR